MLAVGEVLPPEHSPWLRVSLIELFIKKTRDYLMLQCGYNYSNYTTYVNTCYASTKLMQFLFITSSSNTSFSLGWYLKTTLHSTKIPRNNASATKFSWPCLYSMQKSNSMSFTNHFCWNVVANLWSKIYLRLLWSILITNFVSNNKESQLLHRYNNQRSRYFEVL